MGDITDLYRLTELLIKQTRDLQSEVSELKEEVRCLREENQSLRDKVSRYEHPRDSHNSNLPPSKDPIGTKRHTLRKSSGLKSGGQDGHKGSTLKFQIPDFIEELSNHCCQCCGLDLSSTEGEVMEVRQQVELPSVKPVVREYRQLKKICPCCSSESRRQFPANISCGISYGPSVYSLVSYLNVCQHIPYKRLTVLLQEVFGLKLSEGTIYNILDRMQKRSYPAYEAIRERISNAEVAGADETTTKVNGITRWAWAWQTNLYTYIKGGCSRKKEVFTNVMPDGMPNTVLLSDCMSSYFSQNVKHHQICLAHILRELVGLSEMYNNHKWCENMSALIREAIHLRKTIRGKIESSAINKRFEKLLNQTIAASCKGIITLQKRLIKYRDYVFYFLFDERVTPDNNASERAIRTFKVKYKVSGGFKSEAGVQCFAQLHSIVDTAKKNDKSPLAVLQAAALNI